MTKEINITYYTDEGYFHDNGTIFVPRVGDIIKLREKIYKVASVIHAAHFSDKHYVSWWEAKVYLEPLETNLKNID